MYCSPLALASKGVTLVYLPAEIEVTFGRVLKIMYETCLETQTSATVLMMSYSVESASGPKAGAVMMKTVWTSVRVCEREVRSDMSPCMTSTLEASCLAFSELVSRVMARIL